MVPIPMRDSQRPELRFGVENGDRGSRKLARRLRRTFLQIARPEWHGVCSDSESGFLPPPGPTL
eukprot:1506554-Rhodomonas_salina.1